MSNFGNNFGDKQMCSEDIMNQPSDSSCIFHFFNFPLLQLTMSMSVFTVYKYTFILVTIFLKAKNSYSNKFTHNSETDHIQQWGSLLHSLLLLWYKVLDGRMLPSGNMLLYTLHLTVKIFINFVLGTFI